MGVLKQWLPYVLSGISAGGQYALIAVGYTMVYGILRLINFAHGDIFMVAGLIMVYLSATMPLYFALPVVVILTVALGFAVERCAYKPLRQAPRMSVMISAIGVSYLLQNLAYYVTGGVPKQYPELPWISDTITILGASTKRVTVITPILTLALVVVLVILIKRTKVGMAMRAASKDFETAQLMGIKINSVISFTFIIGSALAAVASFLYFSNYTTIAPSSGAMPGLKAFVAAVFGGIPAENAVEERQRRSTAHFKALLAHFLRVHKLLAHGVKLVVGDAHFGHKILHGLYAKLLCALQAKPFIIGFVALHTGNENHCQSFFAS